MFRILFESKPEGASNVSIHAYFTHPKSNDLEDPHLIVTRDCLLLAVTCAI